MFYKVICQNNNNTTKILIVFTVLKLGNNML